MTNFVVMSMQLEYTPYNLKFNFDAGTSRGVLRQKEVWFVKVFDTANPTLFGLGEVAYINRLSVDFNANFEHELKKLARQIRSEAIPKSEKEVFELVQQLVSAELPSIRFALETALLDLMNEGRRRIFRNDFFDGKNAILINGLVWMGDADYMMEQVDSKREKGFKCIKLKIGALDFDKELEVLRYVREKYSDKQLTLRVDANGAFLTEECMLRLKALQKFDLHSIEQPIMPKQSEAMALLCLKSKVAIALDEELIGVHGINKKISLLDEIKPAYIVLKPGLLGGFASTMEWIKIAEDLQIGWWITSALESNVGLNGICQFTSNYEVQGHQGLGTGQLFENNVPSPLKIEGESISYDPNGSWDFTRVEF